MKRKIHLHVSEDDYEALLIPIIGKENRIPCVFACIVVGLHNRVILSLLESSLERQRERQCKIRRLKRMKKNNLSVKAEVSPATPHSESVVVNKTDKHTRDLH